MLFRKNDSDDLFFFLNYNDDNNNNGDSNPSRSIRALSIQKRKGTVCFFFFFFLSQNPCGSSPCQENSTCQAGFTSKGYRCVCPQGLGGENCDQGILLLIHQVMQIFPPFYTSSNANIPAFLYFLVFLFFCFRKFSKFPKVIYFMFKYVSGV